MNAHERELTDEEADIKAQFEDELGYWTEGYEAALRLDPEYLDYYRRLAAPRGDGGILDPKVREFILIAVNNAVTHMSPTAVRIHIENAFELGATFEEIKQVLLLSSGLGIHSMTEGVPILLEEGELSEGFTDELDEEQQRVKERFEASRGYWSSFWESVVKADHEFLDRYTDLSAYPRQAGPLDEKIVEFITIAEDAATTHLYLDGLRIHIQNALDAGGTEREILEVLEVVSMIGMQTLAEGAPILYEVAAERDEHLSPSEELPPSGKDASQ